MDYDKFYDATIVQGPSKASKSTNCHTIKIRLIDTSEEMSLETCGHNVITRCSGDAFIKGSSLLVKKIGFVNSRDLFNPHIKYVLTNAEQEMYEMNEKIDDRNMYIKLLIVIIIIFSIIMMGKGLL